MIPHTQEVISQSDYLQFCMQCSSLALIYYDYLLTLNREVKYIWQHKVQLMSVAFVCCRYSLVANISFLFGLVNKVHHTRCDELYLFSAVLSVVGRIGVMAILGGRACAVWRQNRYLVVLFCVMGGLVTCLALLHIPRVSCDGDKVKESRIATDLLSVFTVVYELLSTTFLIGGCIRNFDSLRQLRKDGLGRLMIKEGLMYTCLVTALTTTGLWLNYAAPVGSFCQRLLNAFLVPLSGIMCARFLLHVREWQEWDQNLRFLEALPQWSGQQECDTPRTPIWARRSPISTLEAGGISEIGDFEGGRGDLECGMREVGGISSDMNAGASRREIAPWISEEFEGTTAHSSVRTRRNADNSVV